jgi:chromatin remodeling complex protein RSC6
MSEETRGRSKSESTVAICEMLNKHGDLSYQNALEHIKAMPKSVRDHFMEVKEDGKNAGANRYNVAKNAWKKQNGQVVKARKTPSDKPKTQKTTRVARVATFNSDAFGEIAKVGGLKAAKAEAARLQKLIEQVEGMLTKVA